MQPSSAVTTLAANQRPNPESEPIDRVLRPPSPAYRDLTLSLMQAQQGRPSFGMDLNDILLTLCTLNTDIRYLTLERIADVVAAGHALQINWDNRKHKRAQRRGQTRARRPA